MLESRVLDALAPVLDVAQANATRVDAEGSFPSETIDALAAAGLCGLLTPAALGGRGGSIPDASRVVEALARRCGSSAMVVAMHYAGAAVLAVHGAEAVNRDISAGRHLSTLAFSEASSRSHFWAPTSTAVDVGDGVALHGRKSWITSANHATAYVWSSRPVGHEGMSTLWLVPRGAAGLSSPAAFDGLGLRGNDSAPMTAEGVRVALAQRLGPDGAGFDIMMGVVLPAFQLMNAACSIGLAEAALAGATAHVAGTRIAPADAALSALPTVRAYLAKARVQTDMARALWEDTMDAVSEGRPDALLRVLECKAAAGDAVLDVVATCMRVCGGAAYRKELGVERSFRDAQAASVMGPTSDVLYDFVGRLSCGLPLFG